MAVVLRIHTGDTSPLLPPAATIQLGWQSPFDALPRRNQLYLLAEFSPLPLLPLTGLPPGGHGDYPRFMPPLDDGAQKKKKPVRPIWDKAPPAAAPTTDPAPAVEKRVPEAQPLPSGPADLSNLARILAPPAPIKVKPSKRKARSALTEAADTSTAQAVVTTLARGALVDDADQGVGMGCVEIYGTGVLFDKDHAIARGSVDITGHARLSDNDTVTSRASIFIRARGQAREDPDVLTAHATWDDDEIALALLMAYDEQ